MAKNHETVKLTTELSWLVLITEGGSIHYVWAALSETCFESSNCSSSSPVDPLAPPEQHLHLGLLETHCEFYKSFKNIQPNNRFGSTKKRLTQRFWRKKSTTDEKHREHEHYGKHTSSSGFGTPGPSTTIATLPRWLNPRLLGLGQLVRQRAGREAPGPSANHESRTEKITSRDWRSSYAQKASQPRVRSTRSWPTKG